MHTYLTTYLCGSLLKAWRYVYLSDNLPVTPSEFPRLLVSLFPGASLVPVPAPGGPPIWRTNNNKNGSGTTSFSPQASTRHNGGSTRGEGRWESGLTHVLWGKSRKAEHFRIKASSPNERLLSHHWEIRETESRRTQKKKGRERRRFQGKSSHPIPSYWVLWVGGKRAGERKGF